MATNVRWKVSFSASCIHLVASMRSGLPLVNTDLVAWLSDPAEALWNELQCSSGSIDRPLRLLQAFASEEENNQRLAELVLVKMLGRDSVSQTVVHGLAGRLSDIEAAVLRARPQMVEELAVRGGPLRSQWDTLGLGLLKQIGRLTDVTVIPDAAEVVIVTPCVGGFGVAHWQHGRVTFEGVLANPHDDLPEVLRLLWLISQLNLNLPKFSEVLQPGRMPLVASLAMIPPVLAAAEVMGLAGYDRQLLRQTCKAWHVDSLMSTSGLDCLHQWWSTAANTQTAWPVALAALDQMLAVEDKGYLHQG